MLQTDVAAIHIMKSQAAGTVVRNNWIKNVPGIGVRFDGQFTDANDAVNCTINNNVIFDTQVGILVKGDFQNITSNTCFGSGPNTWIGNTDQSYNNIIILNESGDSSNINTITRNNAADTISSHRWESFADYPVVGDYSGNFNGYEVVDGSSVESMLVDPLNFNFCPKSGNEIEAMSAGAVDCGNVWTAGTTWNFEMPSLPLSWKNSDVTTTTEVTTTRLFCENVAKMAKNG